MKTSFYLASHDYISSPAPRKCGLLDFVHVARQELLRVQLETPIPHRPFGQEAPIEQVLLAICDPTLTLSDVGNKPVVVDILFQIPGTDMSQANLIRIGTGTLHADRAQAIKFSPLERDER